MKIKYIFCLTVLLPNISHSESLICQPAPLFTAPAVYPNGSVKKFNLENYIGKKLVLYFYPMDNTPGCTKQAKNFRDNIEELKRHGITVIGISNDSVKSHKKFQEKYELPYILVSDARKHQEIAKQYHVKSFFMSKRRTFLVDKDGIIFKKFDDVDIENQVDDILEAFKRHKK